MTDDIVTRLRNWHDQRDSWQTLTEAADEIERLTAERIRWERIAHDLYRRVHVYGEICGCDDYKRDWCGIHAYDDEIMGLKERGES
jgi:hypothetical protein